GGMGFGGGVVGEKGEVRGGRDMEEKIKPYRDNPTLFDEVVAESAKRTRGLAAPAAAIECVRWSFELPMDEAERRVRDKFQELRQGDQSKAQRHILFAEREAAKVPDLPPETKPREIKRAAVIG